MNDAAPLLRITDLHVSHLDAEDPTPAGTTFSIHRGEVVVLLGPSGSGKSTLTLTTNGLIPHAVDADLDGTVEVQGANTTSSSPAQLSTRVGMVFQDPDAQIVTATVFDEVAFALENLRFDVADILARAEAALRRMSLWDRRADDPAILSGGEKQRLAIACALATGAPLLVLDEPTANLDPVGVADVYAALAGAIADGTRGVLLVEHNLEAALTVATRVVALDAHGRVIADGPAIETLRLEHERLYAAGVWLPASLLAARQLQARGWVFEELPVTPEELNVALAANTTSGTAARHPSGAPASPSPAIEVQSLSVKRGRSEIIRDVTLDVARGSFTAIIGMNGSGKTTLVQAMAGVRAAARGSVSIDGRSVAKRRGALPPGIGFVFQNPEHQFVANTVRDELAVGLRHEPQRVRERIVGEILDRFGLTPLAERHPFRLSGGQKRRLSVGTALVTRPAVLVLDEPTFGQDRARADEILLILRELQDAGTTIVIVSHDFELIARHATHVAVMHKGALLAAGGTDEILLDESLLARAGLIPPPLQRVLARHPAAAQALTETRG